MARTVAQLPTGSRITDHISLGVLAHSFPLEKIHRILAESGKASRRQRELPGHVVVYYVIALALYMQVSYREVLRCLLEGLRWLGGWPLVRVTGKSGISQARERVGAEPLRRLHDELVGPLALNKGARKTKGAWYRCWRVVSLDGATLDVADTAANAQAFGRPGASRGESALPQLRCVALVENGTHVLFGARLGPYATGEVSLAREVMARLQAGMLCLADRNFFGYDAWQQAQSGGAQLVWRVKKNLKLPCLKRLEDGSYLSRIYASDKARRHGQGALAVRVIEYQLIAAPDAEPLYRLLTTILDPQAAPAEELAALYHERWEIETALDEFKTHLRGARLVLRSKRPDLVEQEFHGLMLAHYALRGLMHEAALKADEDPDRLSYVHALRVVRRKLIVFAALPPSGPARLASGGAR